VRLDGQNLGENMGTKYFADWVPSVVAGNEFGRTEKSVALQIIGTETISVVDVSRVFDDEAKCCQFVLGELLKRQREITEIFHAAMERVEELGKPKIESVG
jgi:hypothetical protein